MAGGLGSFRQSSRVVVVLALGLLTGACFHPLYGNDPVSASADESIRDKMGAIDISNIAAPKGTPSSRIAVALQNELNYQLNGAATPISPIYRLDIRITGAGATSVIVNVESGRPDTELEVINASFSLTEIETKKVVLTASTFARASFDIPGDEQRFARQRAGRNAEDRALVLLAENIRNRLASYFTAGT
jgi:LPS-assembly lipoprotein